MEPISPRGKAKAKSNLLQGDAKEGYQRISQYFHLPMNEASAKLGVSRGVLRSYCRELGIPRWPYRPVSSVEKQVEGCFQFSRVRQKQEHNADYMQEEDNEIENERAKDKAGGGYEASSSHVITVVVNNNTSGQNLLENSDRRPMSVQMDEDTHRTTPTEQQQVATSTSSSSGSDHYSHSNTRLPSIRDVLGEFF